VFLGSANKTDRPTQNGRPPPFRPIPTPDLWDLIGREQLHRLRDSPSPLPRECPARMTGNVIQFYRPYTRWGAGPEPWARSRWVAARISLGGGPTGPRGILLVMPNLRGTGGSGGGGRADRPGTGLGPPPPLRWCRTTDPTSFLQLVILAYWCCYYFNIPGIPGSTGRCEGSAAEQLTSPLTKMHID
jgi:hypothetical protein